MSNFERHFAAFFVLIAALLTDRILNAQDASSDAPAEEEKLRPGDLLRLQIVQDNSPAAEFRIGKTGVLDVPYMGPVSASGLTLKELHHKLKAALDANFYVDVTLRLSLVERPVTSGNRGRVFISGQVRKVGMIEIDNFEVNTVGKLILANGGLADFADPRRIRVFRQSESGEVETHVVDLREVITRGRMDRDFAVKDGDLIVVESKLLNW